MQIERTLVLLKPDAVQRRLIGEIISRIEQKGLRIVAMKMMQMDRELAERQYAEHRGKAFFNDLIEFITSAPIIAMVVEGPEAVKVIRNMMGATNPRNAQAGTIRGDFGLDLTKNLIHGSDSLETAKREIRLFFKEEEILEYKLAGSDWA